ncbi:hypothetical protein KP003_16710 [Geomonas nitrogeniifigens]|uniref:hypothetical protein n=1 Tax=Geomonas diazotrophica TaxID=2843197 RepID=UPI001C2CB695|nr:hypothetical protein [Geomonas nitrogeniifigens]QXE85983.1 hypothetical protein KP003_16710 [Geomonas nitrogeniifigens]
MQKIAFEEKRFCYLGTLAARWDCSIDYLKDLASKGIIKLWHPEGRSKSKGLRADVPSVLEAEKNGYIPPGEVT